MAGIGEQTLLLQYLSLPSYKEVHFLLIKHTCSYLALKNFPQIYSVRVIFSFLTSPGSKQHLILLTRQFPSALFHHLSQRSIAVTPPEAFALVKAYAEQMPDLGITVEPKHVVAAQH